MVRDPGIRPFDDPSSGQDVEAPGNDLVPIDCCPEGCPGPFDPRPRVRDDFQANSIQKLAHPCLKRALRATLSPDQLERWEASDQGSEQDRRAVTVSDVGGEHFS